MKFLFPDRTPFCPGGNDATEIFCFHPTAFFCHYREAFKKTHRYSEIVPTPLNPPTPTIGREEVGKISIFSFNNFNADSISASFSNAQPNFFGTTFPLYKSVGKNYENFNIKKENLRKKYCFTFFTQIWF